VDETGRGRRGRIEKALDEDLAARPELARAVRANLRALARRLDVAERRIDDLEALGRLSHEFAEQLTACGIAVPAVKTADAWDVLLAELARPGAGSGDRPPA
jgi:hypothetical protein